MTDTQIPQRIKDTLSAHAARKTTRTQTRNELNEARTHGLNARHARKDTTMTPYSPPGMLTLGDCLTNLPPHIQRGLQARQAPTDTPTCPRCGQPNEPLRHTYGTHCLACYHNAKLNTTSDDTGAQK